MAKTGPINSVWGINLMRITKFYYSDVGNSSQEERTEGKEKNRNRKRKNHELRGRFIK